MFPVFDYFSICAIDLLAYISCSHDVAKASCHFTKGKTKRWTGRENYLKGLFNLLRNPTYWPNTIQHIGSTISNILHIAIVFESRHWMNVKQKKCCLEIMFHNLFMIRNIHVVHR